MRIQVSQRSTIKGETSRGIEGVCKGVLIMIDYGKAE